MAPKRGICVVCGIIGQGESDFVCEDCAKKAESGPIFTCQHCRSIGPLNETALAHIKSALPVDLKQPGVIVLTNACAFCVKNFGPRCSPAFKIIRVRLPVN
jgi:hypothetical protein